MALSTGRSLDAFSALQHYLDSSGVRSSGDGEARTAPPITVAITRQAGSRGADIAREVGQLLGWPVYDHELLDRIAEEKGLSARMLKDLDERPVGWLEQSIQSFISPHGPLHGRYLTGLLRVLATLSKKGHCVVVGRGAAHVLPGETTLAVRVVAPRSWRVAQVQQSLHCSEAEAERWVDDHDRERLSFVKRHFHADADDPTLYDLVLNSKRLNPRDGAAMIVQAAHVLESQLVAAKA